MESVSFLCASPRSLLIAQQMGIYHALSLFCHEDIANRSHNAPIHSSDEYSQLVADYFNHSSSPNHERVADSERMKLSFAATFEYLVLGLFRQAYFCLNIIRQLTCEDSEMVYLLDQCVLDSPTLNNGLSRRFAHLVFQACFKSQGFTVSVYGRDIGKRARSKRNLRSLLKYTRSLLGVVGMMVHMARRNKGDVASLFLGTGLPMGSIDNLSYTLDFDMTRIGARSRHAPIFSQSTVSSCNILLLRPFYKGVSCQLADLYAQWSDEFIHRQESNLSPSAREALKTLSLFYINRCMALPAMLIQMILVVAVKSGFQIKICDQLSLLSTLSVDYLRRRETSFDVVRHSDARNEQKLLHLLWHAYKYRPSPYVNRFFVNNSALSRKNSMGAYKVMPDFVFFSYAAYKWHAWKYNPLALGYCMDALARSLEGSSSRLTIKRKPGAEPLETLIDVGLDVRLYSKITFDSELQISDASGLSTIFVAIGHFGKVHYEAIEAGGNILYFYPEVTSIPGELLAITVEQLLASNEDSLGEALRICREQILGLPGRRILIDLAISANAIIVWVDAAGSRVNRPFQ